MNKSDVLTVGSNEMELVDFRIFKEVDGVVQEGIYGVNVAKVREIIKIPKLTELPGAPEFIDGIFDLRGAVIPVVNLAKWMGVDTPSELINSSRIIISEFSNILIGFIVHDAKRIRRISWKDIEPASFNNKESFLDKSKITGITRIEGDNVLLILDLETIFRDFGIYKPTMSSIDDAKNKFSGLALVLDDSSIARKMVSDALSKLGFKVISVRDGEEGICKLNELYAVYEDTLQEELSLIISDVEMPRMDGFHFAAKVKEDVRFKSIPIIFNSSISDQFSEERGRKAGGEAYLVKFDSENFYTEINKIMTAKNRG